MPLCIPLIVLYRLHCTAQSRRSSPRSSFDHLGPGLSWTERFDRVSSTAAVGRRVGIRRVERAKNQSNLLQRGSERCRTRSKRSLRRWTGPPILTYPLGAYLGVPIPIYWHTPFGQTCKGIKHCPSGSTSIQPLWMSSALTPRVRSPHPSKVYTHVVRYRPRSSLSLIHVPIHCPRHHLSPGSMARSTFTPHLAPFIQGL